MKQSKKARAKWLISDELWEEIEPLLPRHNPHQRRVGGRPLMVSDREAMNAIFFVLKTGCPWKALDVTGICPGSIAHYRFQQWRKAGVFKAFWKKGLQKYDKVIGIDWRWLSLDASFAKSPLAGEKKQGKTRQIGANKGRRGVSSPKAKVSHSVS
jgi:transposase